MGIETQSVGSTRVFSVCAFVFVFLAWSSTNHNKQIEVFQLIDRK